MYFDYLIENFVNIQLGIDVFLLFLILFITRKYNQFRAMVQLMTATSPVVPTSEEVLDGWKATLAALPPDSIRRGAYIINIRRAEDKNAALRNIDK